MTGLIGLWFGDAWRDAWLFFAGTAIAATLWNVVYFPSLTAGHLRQDYLKIGIATLFNRGSLVLAFLAAAYGYHLGFYYTFSVDYAVEEFGLSLGSAKMFWMVVGMFGLPAIFTGVVLRTLGLRRLLILSFIGYSASGLVILASSPNLITIYGSAALFGLTSITTGCGLMVLSSNLYVTRPSLGFGIFYVAQSTTLILSPSVSGFLADIATRATSLAVSVRSEEHTSELQSLMRISYAVFCLKKTNKFSRRE